MEGCLLCRDSQVCQLCDAGYYLSGGACLGCSSDCIVCDSASSCFLCAGGFSLSGGFCSSASGTGGGAKDSLYSELSLVSTYVDSSTLAHTLRIKEGSFEFISIDLGLSTSFSLLTEGGVEKALVMWRFEWGPDYESIVFYTENPFAFEEGGLRRMSLFDVRMLEESTQERMRVLVSGSNFQVNANLSLAMDKATAQLLLPNTIVGGSLALSYSINEP
jgi:hypothetical protein